MNVLYILGNGFDKALGMATSYPEFYRHLIDNVKKGSPLLEEMKSTINHNTLLWSDMEEGLGNFTDQAENFQDFENFYFELNEHLQEYLKQEDEKFTPTDKLKSKSIQDLTAITKYFGALDKLRYNSFVKKYGFSSKDISVITLNYTNSLEKICNLNEGVTTKSLGNNTNLQNIIHVHGRLKNSIIVGVDDESQIKNEQFRNNDDIRDFMIKMQSNQVMKETRHLDCEKLIANAHIIILFGVSLGNTDAHWWKLIGENLVNRMNLMIVQHLYCPDAILPTQMQKRGRLERLQQQTLMQKMRIKEEDWSEDIRDRIIFTVNEPLCKI